MRFIIAVLFLMQCASAPAQGNAAGEKPSNKIPPRLASSPGISSVTNPAPARGSTNETGGGEYSLDDKHKLAAGDRVSFKILEDREKEPRSLTVGDSGEMEVPYIGRMVVANKTCREVAAEVKVQLEKEYYYRATVILGVDQASKVIGRVYIWGPVRTQGAIEIPANENFTAGKAILRAGGFGDFANRKEVKVVRKTDKGTVTLKLNMVDILEKGKVEQDITLQPDDFIIVPQRALNF